MAPLFAFLVPPHDDSLEEGSSPDSRIPVSPSLLATTTAGTTQIQPGAGSWMGSTS